MRKYIFGSACCFLLILLGSSCAKEKRFDFTKSESLEMGDIILSSDQATSKSINGCDETLIAEIPFVTSEGEEMVISAFVSDNSEATDYETKSTLIRGAKFGTADGYQSFYQRVYKEGESSCYISKDTKKVETQMQDIPVSYVGSSWRFGTLSAKATYYWPEDGSNLNFFSFAPLSEFSGSGSVSNLTWDKTNHKVSFTYTSPEPTAEKLDAEKQKDIMVGLDSLNKDSKSGNVKLHIQHPLVAVKFVLGNIFGNIERISLQNFYNTGTVTVKTDTIEWNVSTASKKSFSQKFDFACNGKDTTGVVSIDTTAKAVRTFMLIPQQLASDAAMEIKMGNTNHAESYTFAQLFADEPKLADWSAYAGKVITFRVSSKKANLVSVNVNDVTDGSVKKNVTITNDGKSPVYIRAMLVGNWMNESGDVLASWDEKEPYGIFDTTFPSPLPSNWSYNSKDKFYYYKKIIPSEAVVKQNLFSTFTLKSKPESTTVESQKQIKKFELVILVQAVLAEADESKYSLKTAWKLSDSDITSLGITNDLD